MASTAESGMRLARDLRRIREARKLSIGDLNEETKIPLGLIAAFEATALFDHPQFNRVYLRSFVRTYAQVIGIDADVALTGLEEALSGVYAGSLAAAYLGEALDAPFGGADVPEVEGAVDETLAGRSEGLNKEPARRAESTDEPDAAAEPADQSSAAAEPIGEEPTRSGEPSAASDPEAQRRDKEIDRRPSRRKTSDKRKQAAREGRPSTLVSTTSETAAGYEEEAHVSPGESWMNWSPPRAASSRSSAGRRFSSRGPSAARKWIIGGAMIVMAVVISWLVVAMLARERPETVSPVGDLASPPPVETERPTAEERVVPVLGDTMTVRIVASQGVLDPIRVTVDDDLRRPYWIEQGESMTFRPVDRIVIEEGRENMFAVVSLTLEEYAYPTARRDEQGRIVITRESALAFLESL